jgi:hypothetical protein
MTWILYFSVYDKTFNYEPNHYPQKQGDKIWIKTFHHEDSCIELTKILNRIGRTDADRQKIALNFCAGD